MLKRYGQLSFSKISHLRRSLTQQLTTLKEEDRQVISGDLPNFTPEKSVLEPLSEDISHVSTYLRPTFNLAAYANRSELIQQLVKLGVNLHYIEQKVSAAVPHLLRLNFDDVKGHIRFFNDLGVDLQAVAGILTKNPLILKEELDDLQVRVNYLKSKNFKDQAIVQIVSKNPFWLTHKTQDIDNKLGFFQSYFYLSGAEVRELATIKPQLITVKQAKIKLNTFVLEEEMGFSREDIKKLILQKPQLLMNGQHRLLKSFEYLHNEMKIPHHLLLDFPDVLSCRATRIKQRHQFLVKLKRDQFDPCKPNYISLSTMIKDTDTHFATEVAKSSIDEYNTFLKTL